MFLEQGYEGAIIRECTSIYDQGNRSNYLVKYKKFQDEEFEIVGYKEGKGKDTGTIILRCINVNGIEFDCDLEGTFEYRKSLLSQGDTFIGKKLTIKFQEYTDDMIPRFPTGVNIRDEGV